MTLYSRYVPLAPKLTIIIPCFNESLGIESLLAECKKATETSLVSFVFVDNGSIDGTGDRIENLLWPSARLLRLNQNSGYGAGIRAGFGETDSTFIGWFHADQASICHQLDEICENFLQKNVFVKGVRSGREKSSRIKSSVIAFACSKILKTQLYEINAQPSIFPTELIKSRPNPPTDFSIDLYYYYHATQTGMVLKRVQTQEKEYNTRQSRWKTNVKSEIFMAIRFLFAAAKIRLKN